MKVLGIRNISKTAFVLRLERKNFDFVPGQCANIGIPKMATNREYSIYSGIDDGYLEFLIKEVRGGVLSPEIGKLKAGDEVSLDGPYGLFGIKDISRKHILIATGTGIAPYHSMVKSVDKLKYQVIHGVRTAEEEYDRDDYANYISCLSSQGKRVTDYVREHDFDKDNVFYLCGNSQMINDVYDLLVKKGISGSNIHSESFF